MIRRAIGLGLMILILKFLMKSVFVAGEDALVNLLNGASVIFSNVGSMPTNAEIMNLVPR